MSGEDPDDLVGEARRRWSPIATFCLFSGGNDSGVLAHRCRRHYDALVWIDTGTAIPGVEEFVRRYAGWVGKPLVIRRAGDAYRRLVLGDRRWWQRYRAEGTGLSPERFRERDKALFGQYEGRIARGGLDLGHPPWGFPGAGAHGRAYSALKERQIEGLLGEAKANRDRGAAVLLLSGIRRAESRARGGYEPFSERSGAKYVNPLIDWSDARMWHYRRRFEVPESDVAALLHRSGECNCAARGAWWRERDLIRALWPRWFAETIEALEADAKALGVRWCRWGGFDLAGVRAGTEAGERRGPLCADCALEQMPLLEGQVSRSSAPARR